MAKAIAFVANRLDVAIPRRYSVGAEASVAPEEKPTPGCSVTRN
jgi:hypothetical protein